jgi:hypothetical protein
MKEDGGNRIIRHISDNYNLHGFVSQKGIVFIYMEP